MKDFWIFKWFRDISIARKLYFTVGIMALLIGVELFFLTFSIGALSAVRGYVEAEGLWSKAEKDAVYSLLEYGKTRDEGAYKDFKGFMRVPLGDSKTRIELFKKDPDLDIARQGFIEGRVNPADVAGMINLFRRFNSISYIHKAIGVWSEAEPIVLQLLPIGEQLHKEINSPSPSQQRIDALLNQIGPVNSKLTPLEDEFSYTLGEGSRWLERLVFRLLLCIVLTVEVTGLLLAISVSRSIQQGIGEILGATKRFASGKLSARSEVFSKDEIGVLAASFNLMSDQLEQNIFKLREAQKKSEELLKEVAENERKYRELFKDNPAPMWVIEFPSLLFLDVNGAAISEYGYSREEFLAMDATGIRSENERARFRSVIGSSLSGAHYQGVWKHRRKDGSFLDAEVRTNDIVFEGKQARLVISSNVTERIKAEQEIKSLNESLEEKVALRTAEIENANKELEAFSYSVSHDLRSPLRAINGYSKILIQRNSEKLDTEDVGFLKSIADSAIRMGQLIDGLLKLSKMDKTVIAKMNVDFNFMITDVISELKNGDDLLRTEIKLNDLGTGEADPVLIKQVWINLISNAVKYSRKKEHPLVEICTLRNENAVIYYVKDNGAGFQMEMAKKLFSVFGRLHNDSEFEGTGVGLTLVQRIIARHKGKIWAESKEGEGAIFFFTLEQFS